MTPYYIVTGANGHLGGALIRLLIERNEDVRGLILPNETMSESVSKHIALVKGDIREPETLKTLFDRAENREAIVIHTAGIVSIGEEIAPAMYDVNVNGVRNMCALALKHNVKRFIYVSSVHAIPEKERMQVMEETREFSPNAVTGGYAKTKAEATGIVLDYAAQGLNAIVVHPSGIMGPYEAKGNHLVQLIADYLSGKLPAVVKGGYDIVDVRDVAYGILQAAVKGKKGDTFILSNRHYEITDIIEMARIIANKKRKLPIIPMPLVKIVLPIITGIAKLRRRRPLFTRYSLSALTSNDRYSHDKATMQLGYRPRDLFETMKDTIAWINAHMTPKRQRAINC